MNCPHCAAQGREPDRLDHCPVCGRHILDFDPVGCEAYDAQRWCIEHLPDEHPMSFLKPGRLN